MEQQSDYLTLHEEAELRLLLDRMYSNAKTARERGELPRFRGLLEIISSPVVIQTAIHNIKSNKGANTPGPDPMVTRDILELSYTAVIELIQGQLCHYRPQPVRRHYIPKLGTNELRPLGIPSIVDRIVQECVRLVIEPILEAQFYTHSYGFRPYRDTHMALARTKTLVHFTGHHWIIEGDIRKFFDNVNHTRLIKLLWHMGIRDRRVLMIIKAMLKAGVMKEIKINPMGTPQGGIISPLLANAYLHLLDEHVANAWIDKQLSFHISNSIGHRHYVLRKKTNLKPAYLIRYADDWLLVTSSKKNAEVWKKRIQELLQNKLKLTLSKEKTLITNVTKKPIRFLGFTYKVVRGKAKRGWITRSRADPERLKSKIDIIRADIKHLKRQPTVDLLVHQINLINAKIRGIINYYQAATWVNIDMQKYAWDLQRTATQYLKPIGGILIPAKETNNLTSVHSQYDTKISAIKHQGKIVGVTSLSFCRWKTTRLKNPKETPYSNEGRDLHELRTGKRLLMARADELLSIHLSQNIARGLIDKRYNFEYFLNRAYAFNRDKGKCKICKVYLGLENTDIHHIKPYLPLNQVNRVPNLASLCKTCHRKVHDGQDYSYTEEKAVWKLLVKMREKLVKK